MNPLPSNVMKKREESWVQQEDLYLKSQIGM